MVRTGFRTVQNGDLPSDTCDKCLGATYMVPVGDWLHWGTLTAQCPLGANPVAGGDPSVSVGSPVGGQGLEGVSDGREGAKLWLSGE